MKYVTGKIWGHCPSIFNKLVQSSAPCCHAKYVLLVSLMGQPVMLPVLSGNILHLLILQSRYCTDLVHGGLFVEDEFFVRLC